jgi:prophage tail gpP-like protein
MQPDLRLKVDGMLYGGWQEIRIQRSIQQIAGSFELTVTERWSGQGSPRPIRPGAACEVLVDAVPVITGYVDEVQAGYDATGHTIAVNGRDKTGDLVDCSAPYFQFPGHTILSAAERLCKPFGIAVSAETDVAGKFSTYRQNPGDSVFANLDGAAKIRGVVLLSDGNGGLVIARASTVRIPALLATGDNILAASATFSHKDRFSEYTVTSQQEAQDEEGFAETAYHIEAKSLDPVIARHRPLTILADKLIDHKQTQSRADYERNVRYGKSQQVQVTVQGWYYDARNLWPINRLVAVKDEFLGIDADLLITGVAFSLDYGGIRTVLTLAPREGFDLVPVPEEGDLWPTL